MKQFKQIKEIVKYLLTINRNLADDDKKLCWETWKLYLAGKDNFMFKLTYIDYITLPKESTITRARRQLEQFHPELRGETYLKRKHKLEKEAKAVINEEKWNEITEININKNYENKIL